MLLPLIFNESDCFLFFENCKVIFQAVAFVV